MRAFAGLMKPMIGSSLLAFALVSARAFGAEAPGEIPNLSREPARVSRKAPVLAAPPDEAPRVPGLRALETDRPDKTESTLTVDQGHFQLELEIASFTQSKTNPDDVSFGSFELRYGLTNVIDLQVQFDPWYTSLEGGGKPGRSQGFRDTTIRVKWNLAGNDEDRPGLALLPFFKIPTSQEDLGTGHGEGGLLIPMKLRLPTDTELAFEVGVAEVRNDENTDTNVHVISSYSLGHPLWSDIVHAYLEFYSESSPKQDWVATVDTGFTYQIGANMQADVGVNIGVTEATDPWNPFLGYSVRF